MMMHDDAIFTVIEESTLPVRTARLLEQDEQQDMRYIALLV
jgi:hypothetical protein